MKKNVNTQDDFEMYINKSKNNKPKSSIKKTAKPINEEKYKDFSINEIEKAFEKTKKKEIPKKEENDIRLDPEIEIKEEIKKPEKEINESTAILSKEDIIIQKLNYLEESINNIIEVLPEIINKSTTDFNEIQEKMSLLESHVQNIDLSNVSVKKAKIIHFNRDEKGDITTAEVRDS